MSTSAVAVDEQAIEWVGRNCPIPLTDFAKQAVTVLTAIARPHHLNFIGNRSGWGAALDYETDNQALYGDSDDVAELAPVVIGPHAMKARLRGPLSARQMTRLVLAASEHNIRVDVRPGEHLAVDTDSRILRVVEGEVVETDEHPTRVFGHLEVLLVGETPRPAPRRREATQ